MAKRVADVDHSSSCPADIEISNGSIKGYHEFAIKLPIGAYVKVERERGGCDEYSLLCTVPDDLSEKISNTVMTSKSTKKTYKVKDMVGKTVGRMQYFLNKTIVELLEENRVSAVTGVVTGMPTISRKPSVNDKWVRNRKTGGGAIIPCTWVLKVSNNTEPERIVEVLKARLPDCEGHENMEVTIRNGDVGIAAKCAKH